jgi:hypothetical protein
MSCSAPDRSGLFFVSSLRFFSKKHLMALWSDIHLLKAFLACILLSFFPLPMRTANQQHARPPTSSLSSGALSARAKAQSTISRNKV